MRLSVDFPKPVWAALLHTLHSLKRRDKKDIFAVPVRDMLLEDGIQPIRLFNRATDRLQIFFRLNPDGLVFYSADT